MTFFFKDSFTSGCRLILKIKIPGSRSMINRRTSSTRGRFPCMQNKKLLVQKSYANVIKQAVPRSQRSPPASLEAFPELQKPPSQTEPSGSSIISASQPSSIVRTTSSSACSSSSSSLRTQKYSIEASLGRLV